MSTMTRNTNSVTVDTSGMLSLKPIRKKSRVLLNRNRWRCEPIPHVPKNCIVITAERVLYNAEDDYEDYALLHAVRTMVNMRLQKRRRGAGVP